MPPLDQPVDRLDLDLENCQTVIDKSFLQYIKYANFKCELCVCVVIKAIRRFDIADFEQ